MAFAYTGGASATSTGATTASVTHGLTINSGDLVVAYVNRNDSVAISNDAGGSAWTEALQDTPPSGETASQALFWKIAGGSEPATYTWSLTSSSRHQVIVKVFTSDSDAVVDTSAVSVSGNSSAAFTLDADAPVDEVVSDNSVSVVFGGQDTVDGTENAYTAVSNSYVGLLGTDGGQISAGAHRFFATGATLAQVSFTGAGRSFIQLNYSIHISFVEDGGGGISIPVIMNQLRNQGIS